MIASLLSGNAVATDGNKIELDPELQARLVQFQKMLSIPDIPAADRQVILKFVNHADLMDRRSFTTTAKKILHSDEVSIETKRSIASLPGAPSFDIKTGSDLKSALNSQESYRKKLVVRTQQLDTELEKTNTTLADLKKQLADAEFSGDFETAEKLRPQIKKLRDQQYDLKKQKRNTEKAADRVRDDETEHAKLRFHGLDIALDGTKNMLIRDGDDRIALPMKLLFTPAAMRNSVDTFLVFRRLKKYRLEKLFFDPDVECSRGSPPTPGQRHSTRHLLATIGLATPGEIISPRNTTLFESILKNLEIPPATDPIDWGSSVLPKSVLKNGHLNRRKFAQLLKTVRDHNSKFSILRSDGTV